MQIKIYTDGGSRGNPGISAYGIVILDGRGQTIFQESKFLGIKTNNEAEYLGIIAALAWVKNNRQKLSIDSLTFFSDSQLLVRQIQGKYKVKAKNLQPLFNSVHRLLASLHLPCRFQDVRRHQNRIADALANQAMDDYS